MHYSAVGQDTPRPVRDGYATFEAEGLERGAKWRNRRWANGRMSE